MPEPTNAMRAGWARAAADTFTSLTYGERALADLHSDDQVQALADLVCDVLHLARELGATPGGVLGSASRHFDEEEREEIGAGGP